MKFSRRRKPTPSLVVITVVFLVCLLLCNFGIHRAVQYNVRNSLYNSGYVSCGFRKLPLIYVYDDDHVTIVWETNCELTDVSFFHWYTGDDGKNLKSTRAIEIIRLDETRWLYKVKVGPLTEQGEYKYCAVSKELHTEEYAFSHLPRARANGESPIRVACLADNQDGLHTFSHILSQVARHQPDYLIHAGDAVQTFSVLRHWQTDFFDPLTRSGLGQRTPIVYAHGNHDEDVEKQYDYTNGRVWFAFNLGGARIIVLDSNIDDEAQDDFLRQELSSPASVSATFRIVIVHVPPFIEFWTPESWNEEKIWGDFVRTRFVPLFQSGKVDLVISGHQHNYQRGSADGIVYTIVGGAGGNLDFDRVENWNMYEKIESRYHFVMIELWGQDGEPNTKSGEVGLSVAGNGGMVGSRLVWTAYGLEGDVIDRFELHQQSKNISSTIYP